ncbi:acyltransferase [Pseudomonas brassicacearum]|jgi:acetyltransferase-like isoleucine patch superfamily enzyme|nr:acyltransferase [Pseudomonas brassicacearum]
MRPTIKFKRQSRSLFVRIVIKIVQIVRVAIYRYLYSTNKATLVGTQFRQPVQLVGSGQIYMNKVVIGVWPSPGFINNVAYVEARSSGARVIIGAGTTINNGLVIIADKETIEIGENCLIGTNVYISDSDFHGLEVSERHKGDHLCESVAISDNVFIGNDVKILKGVSIGEGAIIANSAVVTRDVEPGSVYAGIPAKLIRRLEGKL